jgi:hypothetical protein
MYPAQALFDGLYTVDDLPDVVDFTSIFSSFSLNKLTNPEPYGDGLKYYQGQSEDAFILLIPDSIDDGDAAWVSGPGTGGFSNSRCLIFGEGTSVSISDQFADTYAISGPISGTVTRESICVWRGSNLRLTNFGYQWKVNGNNKTGNQNTPVGSYAGGYSVS